jgi:hypothetical protein
MDTNEHKRAFGASYQPSAISHQLFVSVMRMASLGPQARCLGWSQNRRGAQRNGDLVVRSEDKGGRIDFAVSEAKWCLWQLGASRMKSSEPVMTCGENIVVGGISG